MIVFFAAALAIAVYLTGAPVVYVVLAFLWPWCFYDPNEGQP